MSEIEGDIEHNRNRIQEEILRELKKNNELLESILVVQSNVQTRQRKFWFMALTQIALIVVVLAWWGSKYGF